VKDIDDDSLDDNPFENIPSDLSYSGSKKVKKGGEDASSPELSDAELDEYLLAEGVSKSALALVSGVGFVFVALLVYFFVTMYSDFNVYILLFLGILLPTLISVFYLLDELTIRPLWLTSRGGHFISGMFLGGLALLIIFVLNTYTDWIFFIIPFLVIVVLMSSCISLFLYAMLWEE
jgi:hypothetical protein